MNRWVIVSAALFACTVGSSHARDVAQDEREIRRVEAALCQAFEKGDAETLRKDLDPSFTLTGSTGAVTDYEQNVAEVAQRDPAYEIFRNHDQKVRLYGNAAIVTGITSIKGQSGGKAFDGDFQFTDTWIYVGGHWKLAASHASRLPK
jgi:ketosteroid isomerase-like protein